ncbi:MAG: nucleotidyltransferase domain-containing protein [Oscillospiraceae bacterium]|nr:nucleotidyltransferase domain-containing protein [Oscillospiraceae bacterium]
MNIGLSPKHIALIIDALKNCSVKRAIVFGSRAKGDWRDNSDIDIAVFGGFSEAKIAACLDELPMPYKFDVVCYDELGHKPLREHIDRVGVELF